MEILKSKPNVAKINGKPVSNSISNNLLKINKSVIKVDKLLETRFKKKVKQINDDKRKSQKELRNKKENRIESTGGFKDLISSIPTKIPGVSAVNSLKTFLIRFILGFFAIKLIPLLPKLKGFLLGLSKFADFVVNIGGKFLNGIISFIDFGVRAGDATIGFIRNIGGEKTAELFSAFGSALSGLLDAAILIGTLSLSESLSGRDDFDFFNKKKTKLNKTSAKKPSNNIRKFKIPKATGRFAKIKNFAGRSTPVLNIIFGLFDFAGRKQSGQTTLQAGAGVGGGFIGSLIAAATAAVLIPEPTSSIAGGLVLALLSGLGYMGASSLTDKITGADKIQEKNEGGIIKGDRFKQDKLKLPSTNISPLVLSDVGKKVFPNDIEYLPKSGDAIQKSFNISKNGILGPVIGVAYKMLAGQNITTNDSQVVSDYLKVGSKLGFKAEDIQKGLTEKSSRVRQNLESESRVEEISGPDAKGYPFTKFLLNLSKAKDPKGGGVQLFYKNEVESIRNMLETIFRIVAVLGAATAAVAAFTVGLPALVGVLTKIVAPVVTSAPTLIARIFQSATPAATKLARGVSQGVATGVRQAAARGARKVGMTNVGRVAKDQVVDTTARTIIKKPIRTARTIIKKPIRFEQQVLDLTAKKPGQLSLSKKILQPKTFAKSVKEASVPRPATNIEKTFDRLTTVRPTKGGFERFNRPTDLKVDIKSDIPDPFSTGPIRKGVDVLDIFKKPIIKKTLGQGRVTSPKQLNLSRKVLDPNRFSREAVKAAKQQKLIRDKANEALRKSDVGDDLLKSVQSDPRGPGVRSAVERETGSIIRDFKDMEPQQLNLSRKVLDPKRFSKEAAEAAKQQKLTGNQVPGFNLGGFVQGAGGIDNIPAMLSPREFVLDRDSTTPIRKEYPGFLNALNKASGENVIKVLQSYASYEDGGGGKEIIIQAPVTEINIVQDQSAVVTPRSGGGDGNDPFESLVSG